MKKRSLFSVDVVEKTITASAATLSRAKNPNSKEYAELCKLMKQHYGFEIEKKATNKKTYDGMTFNFMRNYILAQPESEDVLVEFECVKRTNGDKYAPVKKWFLNTYKDESGCFDMDEAKREITDYRIKMGQDMAEAYLDQRMAEIEDQVSEIVPADEPVLSLAEAVNQ